MRLIDADEIENKAVPMDSYDGFWSGTAVKLSVIRKSPTIDAVPVVRCRECIAYTPVDDNTGKCVFLIGKHQYVVPDGYCYLGERQERADTR